MKQGTLGLTFEKEERYWWYVGRLNIIHSIFNNLFKEQRHLKILNLGCGTGIISRSFDKHGKVYSLDIDSEALSFCRKRGLDKLIQADSLFLPFRERSFDLILVLDILEHAANDGELLMQLNKVLKDTGYLIITVPSYTFMWTERDEVATHLRRYTKTRLLKKITGSNFYAVKMSYFNSLFFPIAFLEKCYMKLRRKKVRPDDFLPRIPGYINFLLTIIFSSEKALLRFNNLPFGLSLMAVCKKNNVT